MAWKLERNNKLVAGQQAIQNAHLKQPKTPRNSGSNPNQNQFPPHGDLSMQKKD
jgi:hypothetical protein